LVLTELPDTLSVPVLKSPRAVLFAIVPPDVVGEPLLSSALPPSCR
jgi:hypothetical protein